MLDYNPKTIVIAAASLTRLATLGNQLPRVASCASPPTHVGMRRQGRLAAMTTKNDPDVPIIPHFL